MKTSSPLSRWLIPNQYYQNQLSSYEPEGYSLCIIEFDDQGELWDPSQLDATLRHVQRICGGSQAGDLSKGSGEVIVITFVHGWMHNAAPEDKNFELFAHLIKTRAAE